VKRDVVIIGSCGANLASLGFALERLGVEAPVTTDAARVRAATHVLLPGVGAAGTAMSRLAADGLAEVVPTLGQPVLGICLGMQLLFAGSAEDDTKCLGVIEARAGRLPQSTELPVPQMGWNRVEPVAPSALLDGVAPGAYAYFIHSYAVPLGPYTRAVTHYGVPFSCVIEQRNFYGTQFHPERSSAMGARILDNFLKISLQASK
jgi:glutamine amidotransferase